VLVEVCGLVEGVRERVCEGGSPLRDGFVARGRWFASFVCVRYCESGHGGDVSLGGRRRQHLLPSGVWILLMVLLVDGLIMKGSGETYSRNTSDWIVVVVLKIG
jgi:hypothetical protein